MIKPTPIRTLADVTLVPTPVTFNSGLRDERVEEQMRAELLADLKGQTVTLVASGAMTAEPWTKVVRFGHVEIGPRCAGGRSPWQLRFRYRHKREHDLMDRDFPVDPILLLRGAHTLDVKEIIASVPFMGTDFHRYRDESHTVLWALVSSVCEEVAGAGRVLIDTTDEAIRYQITRLEDWKNRSRGWMNE